MIEIKEAIERGCPDKDLLCLFCNADYFEEKPVQSVQQVTEQIRKRLLRSHELRAP